MRRLLQTSSPIFSFIAALFCFSLLLTGLVMATRAYAAPGDSVNSAQRLITVHEGGKERGILTSKSTLRDAFNEAGIVVDPSDLIEPGLDEELVASSYDVNIYRARPVMIADGLIRRKVLSPYRTAKQIVEHAGMKLQSEDTTSIEATTTSIVADGAGVRLTIDRATEFTLVLYGQKTTAYSQASTVGEMLKEKGIALKEQDTLSVASSTALSSGMVVELWRNGTQTLTEEQAVEFDIEQIKDADREVGYKEIKTLGVPGKKSVTYEIDMKNGQEISRKEIQSVVIEEPKKQVEIIGSKMANTFDGGFAEALARLRSCEGSYTSNTGNGYYGAYQYDVSTWGNYKGYTYASDAPATVQDERAWQTYQARGWQPWPSCSRKMGLQDIYR